MKITYENIPDILARFKAKLDGVDHFRVYHNFDCQKVEDFEPYAGVEFFQANLVEVKQCNKEFCIVIHKYNDVEGFYIHEDAEIYFMDNSIVIKDKWIYSNDFNFVFYKFVF